MIETFAGENPQPMESIIIGKETANGLYHFARPLDKEEIWLIDGSYTLPDDNYSWLMQPILIIRRKSSKKSLSAKTIR
ncbi:MAG: hypothetical protein ACLU99_07505 [Alphaproteobacteria bacterium]